MTTKRGVAICHYDRLNNLEKIVESVKATTPKDTRIVICDDGSASSGLNVLDIADKTGVLLVRGQNLGVAANKNRALWALHDCHFLTILEDDLIPTAEGWFEDYEKAMLAGGIHHFCRVQDKEIASLDPQFDKYMKEIELTPKYGPHPRGDLTFISKAVVTVVGSFNPVFRGAGYAHGEWSNRVWKSGLISHPNKWVDIQESSAKFTQIGDTEGGRWKTPEKVEEELARNRKIRQDLDSTNFYKLPLELE